MYLKFIKMRLFQIEAYLKDLMILVILKTLKVRNNRKALKADRGEFTLTPWAKLIISSAMPNIDISPSKILILSPKYLLIPNP